MFTNASGKGNSRNFNTLHKEGKKIMASKLKPICKYGEKCYRKNPKHLAEYSHPESKSDEV